MTLQQARKLRDFLRSHKIKATVPLGMSIDCYHVKAVLGAGVEYFQTVAEYNTWATKSNEENLRRLQETAWRLGIRSKPRSSIEILIDQATGNES